MAYHAYAVLSGARFDFNAFHEKDVLWNVWICQAYIFLSFVLFWAFNPLAPFLSFVMGTLPFQGDKKLWQLHEKMQSDDVSYILCVNLRQRIWQKRKRQLCHFKLRGLQRRL